MKAYNFRFEEADVNTWKARAKQQGLSLSEWIRKRCNALSVVDYQEQTKEFHSGKDEYSGPLTMIEEFDSERKPAPVDMRKFLP